LFMSIAGACVVLIGFLSPMESMFNFGFESMPGGLLAPANVIEEAGPACIVNERLGY